MNNEQITKTQDASAAEMCAEMAREMEKRI